MTEQMVPPHANETWLGARVILSDPWPEPNFTDHDMHTVMLEFTSLKEIMGPLVNGIYAFTWEDTEEVATTAQLIERTREILGRGWFCEPDEHETNASAEFRSVAEGEKCLRCPAVVVSHEGGYGPDGSQGLVVWSEEPR